MSGAHVLVELVVVLGTAAVITVVFQAVRLPVVLGYVLAGLLIGPHVPVPLVADPELVHVLSELGIILLMFAVGTELRLRTLARVGLPAGLTALFEVGLVIVAGTLVARALGFGSVEALFAGCCMGISSTMIVAKAFEDRGWKGGFIDVVVAVLVFEDVISIVLLAVLTGVASGAGLGAADIAVMIGKLAGFLAALLGGGLIVVPRVMRFIVARSRSETVLIWALALCFGAAALADHAGYSVALGAFIAGVLVAESGHGHEVFALVRPFRDVFAMVFFVSVGMSIAPAELAANLPAIAAFTAIVLLVKPLGVALGVFFAGHGIQPAVRAGVSLSQIGEMAFVIAGVGISGGVARPSLLAIAVGVACVTTLTSGVGIGRSEGIAAAIARLLPGRITTFESFYQAWLSRLRRKRDTPWRKLRRPVVVLALDMALLCAIVIAASQLAPESPLAIAGAVVLAAPFFVSLVRRIAAIAHFVAREVIPHPEPRAVPLTAAAGPVSLDLGRAPRRALTLILSLGLSLAVAVPVVAVIQPFVPAGPAVIALVAIGLVAVARRSLRDFAGHVRAGSELLLQLMQHPETETAAAAPLADAETVLPGFGGVASVSLAPTSRGVGHSLAALDLRARTGATVLAIARGEAGLTAPSPSEPLREGDVLALAGSEDAIAAARAMLE